MKYVKGENFNKIDALDNYKGLGRSIFEALERGEKVKIESPPQDLIANKCIKAESVKK